MPSFNEVINWLDFSGICFWNTYYSILNFILLYFFVYIISKSNTSWSWKGGSPPGGPHHGSTPRTLVVENLKIFIFSLEPSFPQPPHISFLKISQIVSTHFNHEKWKEAGKYDHLFPNGSGLCLFSTQPIGWDCINFLFCLISSPKDWR